MSSSLSKAEESYGADESVHQSGTDGSTAYYKPREDEQGVDPPAMDEKPSEDSFNTDAESDNEGLIISQSGNDSSGGARSINDRSEGNNVSSEHNLPTVEELSEGSLEVTPERMERPPVSRGAKLFKTFGSASSFIFGSGKKNGSPTAPLVSLPSSPDKSTDTRTKPASAKSPAAKPTPTNVSGFFLISHVHAILNDEMLTGFPLWLQSSSYNTRADNPTAGAKSAVSQDSPSSAKTSNENINASTKSNITKKTVTKNLAASFEEQASTRRRSKRGSKATPKEDLPGIPSEIQTPNTKRKSLQGKAR